MWRSAGCFSCLCCWAGRSVRRSSRSWCSGMSWPSFAGSRGERGFGLWIARSSQRSRERCRGAPWGVCRCVRRRCFAGTANWSSGAGRIRTDGRRGGRRSIVEYRCWLFGSHARTLAGVTDGSSANCEASASVFSDFGADDPRPAPRRSPRSQATVTIHSRWRQPSKGR
jgi:hypothetical protein